MDIKLNKAEQKLAQYLARCRYENNRRENVVDRKIGPQSNNDTDLNGIGAELAFCKLFNLYPDIEIDHRPQEDAIFHDGTKVDIKTTPYKNGRLITPIWKKQIHTDLYALMIGKFPEYRLAGIVTADKLFQDENIVNLGYGNTYALEQVDLDIAY